MGHKIGDGELEVRGPVAQIVRAETVESCVSVAGIRPASAAGGRVQPRQLPRLVTPAHDRRHLFFNAKECADCELRIASSFVSSSDSFLMFS